MMRTGRPGGGQGRRGGRRGGRNGGREREEHFDDRGEDNNKAAEEEDADMGEAGLNRKRVASNVDEVAGSGVAKTILMLENGTSTSNPGDPLSPSSKQEPKRNKHTPLANDRISGKNNTSNTPFDARLAGSLEGSRLAQ